MGEFFKPWRRKIGVVTLVLACILFGGWVRSQTHEVSQTVLFYERLTVRRYLSWTLSRGDMKFVYHKYNLELPSSRNNWGRREFNHEAAPTSNDPVFVPIFKNYTWTWHRNWGFLGSRFAVVSVDEFPYTQASALQVPLMPIVMLLTLASACLLLLKPRPTIQKEITEPNIVEAA